MAARKPLIPVPKFRPYTLKLAELCAIDLWNGIDYETGKTMEISDEELLVDFAVPFKHLYENPQTAIQISEYSVRRLIRVGRLKALFRSTQGTDFPAGIAAIKTKVLPIYDGWRNGTLKLVDTGYGLKSTLDLGASFVTGVSAPTINGNYRVPLASRLLFYMTPDMKVFNFSNGLAKAMQLQSRPQAAIGEFSVQMQIGLDKNINKFRKLKLPQPKLLGEDFWTHISKSDWWQRRVLDLAMLLQFNVLTARPALQAQAHSYVASLQPVKKII
jgi:hypothetical protein